MLRLSVGDAPRELRAAVLAARAARRDIRNDLNRRVRTFKPIWADAITSNSGSDPRDALLSAGARIAPGNPPRLVTASTKKKVGRLIAVENWAGIEYGANHALTTRYDRTSTKGTRHAVTRHVRTGLPRRRRKGRVIEPAVTQILPRIASLWAQTVVRTYLDALEGKN